jgi:hypothetical protein
MLGPSNYISFLTVMGFFLGVSFALLKTNDPEMLLFWTMTITSVFYITAVAIASFFIRTTQSKKKLYLETDMLEIKLDKLIADIRRREYAIKDTIDFRREIELEEAQDIHSNKINLITTKR